MHPDPTISPATDPTHSTRSASPVTGDDSITLPVGAFATILALAGLLSVVLLFLALVAWRRRSRSQAEAEHEVNDYPDTGTLTPLKSQAQQDGGHGSTLEVATPTNDEAGKTTQTLGNAEKVRVSVSPGWPKRIAQLATGQESRKQYVDFEMVTGEQAAR